jgi:hypothetical protein
MTPTLTGLAVAVGLEEEGLGVPAAGDCATGPETVLPHAAVDKATSNRHAAARTLTVEALARGRRRCRGQAARELRADQPGKLLGIDAETIAESRLRNAIPQ